MDFQPFLAKVSFALDIYFSFVWSRFKIRLSGIIWSSTRDTILCKYKSLPSFFAPSRISILPVVFLRFLNLILQKRFFVQDFLDFFYIFLFWLSLALLCTWHKILLRYFQWLLASLIQIFFAAAVRPLMQHTFQSWNIFDLTIFGTTFFSHFLSLKLMKQQKLTCYWRV